MHTLLCQLKNRLDGDGRFDEYQSLGVSPMHVHRSKTAHKRAIFILGKEIAAALSSGEFSNADLVSHRMDAFRERAERVRVP